MKKCFGVMAVLCLAVIMACSMPGLTKTEEEAVVKEETSTEEEVEVQAEVATKENTDKEEAAAIEAEATAEAETEVQAEVAEQKEAEVEEEAVTEAETTAEAEDEAQAEATAAEEAEVEEEAVTEAETTAEAENEAQAEATAAEEVAVEEASGFGISRLVICAAVDNREPVGATDTFSASTEEAFCFIEANDIVEDTQTTVVWSLDENELARVNLPLKKSARWRTYSSKKLAGLKGDWKVEVLDEQGRSVKEASFSVK